MDLSNKSKNSCFNKKIGLKTTIAGKNYILCLIPRSKCSNITSDKTDCDQNILVLIEETELNILNEILKKSNNFMISENYKKIEFLINI